MKGTQCCGNCHYWASYSSASLDSRTLDGRLKGSCQLQPTIVSKTETSWCGQWRAANPDTQDAAALAMCEAYTKGDITLALAIADKLRELAGG